jgi:hypothetical protein
VQIIVWYFAVYQVADLLRNHEEGDAHVNLFLCRNLKYFLQSVRPCFLPQRTKNRNMPSSGMWRRVTSLELTDTHFGATCCLRHWSRTVSVRSSNKHSESPYLFGLLSAFVDGSNVLFRNIAKLQNNSARCLLARIILRQWRCRQ